MRVERIIISGILKNDSYRKKAFPHLHEEYFHDKKELNIFEIVKKHISKYKSAPVKDELLTEVQTIQMTDKDVEDCQRIVTELFDIETSDEEWLLEKTEKWCQEKSVYNAVMESISIIDGTVKKNKNIIPDILKQALAVTFKIELGHDYIEDADARFEYYNKKDEKKIPFGIDLFNKVTRGGIASKTLNVVMAGTNVGKSFFMTDFASHCLANQKNVLYITLEMSEEELARRIDANLLNVKINELDEVPTNMLKKKLEEKSRNIKGKLIFKEFPTGRGSAADFNKLLDELELKKGFKPDILFIDYINICASSTLGTKYKADKYLYIKTIAEELRGLAVEKDIPIFTATQTNREGYGDSDPDLTNTSESWGLPATADFMFAMMTDDQLEQLSQFRIKQLKNRYNRKDSNKRFCIGYDLMKMRLFDVDDNSVGSVSTGQQQDAASHGSSFLQKKKTLDFSGISI